MPCYRCGTRQVDPDRGESPWKRGVRGDRQVLICPGCQAAFDWMADLDRCPVCTGIRLVRRLGEAECRDCGSVGQPAAAPSSSASSPTSSLAGVTGPGSGAGSGTDAGAAPARETVLAPGYGGDRDDGASPGLAEEVELALARVLGRTRRPAGIG
jgi:hypothetical protein